MDSMLIGLIALVTVVWTVFLQGIDKPVDQTQEIQIMDSRPLKYDLKVLGATFQEGKFTGHWYKKEGRLEILRSGQLVKILYLVDEGRAGFHFRRWIRDNS